ncbi:tetratricopeptide repeat protein [Clostridia bacterium OttesenSCG-928-O13]|nr:tetratricopeptide repeat protein [Clostridia bacterium OttesenSCG-928-O13]
MKKCIAILLAAVLLTGLLTACGTSKPPDVSALLTLGQKYLADGDYEKALSTFQQVLDIDPQQIDAYLGMADAHLALDDPDAAMDILQEGLDATDSRRIERRIERIEQDKAPPPIVSTSAPPDSDPNVPIPTTVLLQSDIDALSSTISCLYLAFAPYLDSAYIYDGFEGGNFESALSNIEDHEDFQRSIVFFLTMNSSESFYGPGVNCAPQSNDPDFAGAINTESLMFFGLEILSYEAAASYFQEMQSPNFYIEVYEEYLVTDLDFTADNELITLEYGLVHSYPGGEDSYGPYETIFQRTQNGDIFSYRFISSKRLS